MYKCGQEGWPAKSGCGKSGWVKKGCGCFICVSLLLFSNTCLFLVFCWLLPTLLFSSVETWPRVAQVGPELAFTIQVLGLQKCTTPLACFPSVTAHSESPSSLFVPWSHSPQHPELRSEGLQMRAYQLPSSWCRFSYTGCPRQESPEAQYRETQHRADLRLDTHMLWCSFHLN